MAISCVYCGSSHSSASDVRDCWQRTGGVLPADAPSLPFDGVSAAPEHRSSTPALVRPDAAQGLGGVARRGPGELSRNVLVLPGADLPAEWAGCHVVHVGHEHVEDPSSVIVRLRAAAIARESLVLAVSHDAGTAIAAGARAAVLSAPSVLGPRFEIELASLHHLLTANAVDARSEPAGWWLLDQACALGAQPAPASAGDIVLADGTNAWLDGGPLRYTAPITDPVRGGAVAVVHRITVEHGSLRPLGAQNTTDAELADDQLAAVVHDGGSARIIAPAGSGKTRVLTERARHLLHQWHLPPGAVCLVAFNKRAQEEMRARTDDLRGLQIRTLNAIALAIVNGSAPFAPQRQQLRTIDEGEVRRIIGNLVSFPRKRNADPVAPWIEALSLARLGLRDPAKVEDLYDGEVDGFAAVYPLFRAELARANSVDFDEQIQRAIELLLRDDVARAAAQLACRVLLVDEFQDLTPAHLLLIRLLAGPDLAVFGVGDDDQTIYGYNGADPGWLIDFARLFPGAGEHPLEVNYRCPGGIVAAADMLLRHNRRRVRKTIRAAHTETVGWSVRDEGDPVATTIDIVTTAIAEGRAPGDIAVLTRVNSLLAPVQVALVGQGVPVSGGVGAEFVERTSVRAALAWLRLASAQGRQLSPTDLSEALRRPARPLHPNVSRWVGEQSGLDGLRRLAGRLTTEREAERVVAFADDIERLQGIVANGGTTTRVFTTLRDSLGLASTVTTLDAHRQGMNRASQSDDLTAIAQLALLHPDVATFESWLRAALRVPWQSGGVTLATVHRVKGLEWPVVVVHQADADQFPHRLAEDREEERRLFHVALTRAGSEAFIVPGEHRSAFIAELTTEPSASPEPELPSSNPKPATAPAGRPGDQLTGGDQTLFEALRDIRRHLAAGKPAYTVVADVTLAAIAQARPTSLAELSRIKGIGPSKLEQFGPALLAAVESAPPSG